MNRHVRSTQSRAERATIDSTGPVPGPANRYGQETHPMGELLTPTHLIVVLVVALLIFGPKKLPDLGKGLGEGLRGFKEAIKGTPDPVKEAAPPPKEISTEVK